MNFKLVTYRTTDYRYKQWAVVPELYLSDLLQWLKLSEQATILSVTDNPHGAFFARLSDFVPPIGWPSSRTCSDYIRVSDLVASAR